MKGFTVTWHPEAEDELVRIWINFGDRRLITQAVARIDNELAEQPASCGEAVREGVRSLNVPPLRVWFVVRPDDRLAEVLMVSVLAGSVE